ncbi:Protein RTF1 [Sarracenia purpurea var. burkii]
MADLEKLLLEAAGMTSNAGRNRHSPPASRRRRDGSVSDDGSDSKDDDSDDDRNYASRKPSGSQVPLKKRLDPTERDDYRSSQEEGDGDDDDDGYNHDGDSGDDDSVGSDLYKDEADRQKLAEMTELEREFILSERASKKDDKELREKMMRSKRNDKTPQPRKEKESPRRTSSRGVRSSARSADRAAAKDDALNELRAKRLKHQDPEAHRKSRDAVRGSSGGSRGFSPIKRRTFTPASLSSSSRSESGSQSEDDEESTGDGGMIDSDEDKTSPDSDMPTFEDIKEISIRRSKLAKWFMEPFFDELIVGCFVRVGIGKSKTGSIYRLCMVRNVDASDPDRQYKLENKMTYKYLNVVWGNETSAARWQMAMVSDSPPVKEEFDQWVKEVERSGGRMPSKQDVLEKKEAIQKTNTFVYSAATVKQMLQEKKSATRRPLNVAAEKDRLRREMEVAKGKNDELEVEKIKARLQELEASRQVQEKDAKAIRLAEMNRRNRVENFKNASNLKPVNTGLKAGEAGYDPFSRRWTRSRNYYVAKPNGGEEAATAAANDDAVVVTAVQGNGSSGGLITAEVGMAATAAALEAAADAGKLVDTSAPVDQGTESNVLHDFELPISLAVLQKFGGPQGAQAGFMARKQKIEATIGCQVPDNDGRRHALTLTVSDYKRRRGLL